MRYGGEDIASSRQLCVFSNIRSYVSNIKEYFEHTWKNAVPVEVRVAELERIQMKGMVHITVDSAENLKKYPLKELHEKGVKVKILMPVNAEDSQYLREIEKYAEIRHITEVSLLSSLMEKKEGIFEKIWQSSLPLKKRMQEIENN